MNKRTFSSGTIEGSLKLNIQYKLPIARHPWEAVLKVSAIGKIEAEVLL